MFTNFTKEEIDFLYRAHFGYLDNYDHRLFRIGKWTFRVSEREDAQTPFIITAPDGTVLTTYQSLQQWIAYKRVQVYVFSVFATSTGFTLTREGKEGDMPKSMESQLKITQIRYPQHTAVHTSLTSSYK